MILLYTRILQKYFCIMIFPLHDLVDDFLRIHLVNYIIFRKEVMLLIIPISNKNVGVKFYILQHSDLIEC